MKCSVFGLLNLIHFSQGRAYKNFMLRDGAILHHDLHDQRGIRERGLGDGQREDFLHFYDGHLR